MDSKADGPGRHHAQPITEVWHLLTTGGRAKGRQGRGNRFWRQPPLALLLSFGSLIPPCPGAKVKSQFWSKTVCLGKQRKTQSLTNLDSGCALWKHVLTPRLLGPESPVVSLQMREPDLEKGPEQPEELSQTQPGMVVALGAGGQGPGNPECWRISH